jgi:hypothetical protein
VGYGFYTVVGWGEPPEISQYGTRPAGYMVLATCDRRGCDAEIDRGLGYLCGDEPHGPFDDARGCGRYYCGKHGTFVGPRGGCSHRGKRAWGRTLSCMAPKRRWLRCLSRPC